MMYKVVSDEFLKKPKLLRIAKKSGSKGFFV